MTGNGYSVYKYMKDTSKSVAKRGILKYLESYSHPEKTIRESNAHLPLLRMFRSKGLRARPQLMSAFGRMIYENLNKTKNDWYNIIPFLSSMELVLTSTYLIDDVVDRQEKRFGDDATWVKYGLNEAIFSSFRLREIAEKIIINEQKAYPIEKIKILGLISDIHRKTYEGQSLNDKLVGNYNHEIYMERCRNFGAVFAGCVATGSAILAKADKKQLELAKEIGNNYGTAIMIRNDLKDFMTSELINFDHGISTALKRIPLEDFRIGRITYPLHVGLNNPEHETELRPLIAKGTLSSDEERRVVSAIARSGGLDKTIELIEKYKTKALVLCDKLPENPSRESLKELIGLMRNSKNYSEMIKESVQKKMS
jgi:geranylgeranyl pyrophosphate synthase